MARPRKVQPDAAVLTETRAVASGDCVGFFQVDGSQIPFGLEIPDGTSYVIIQAERTPFRWLDGQDPDNFLGMRLIPDQERRFDANLDKLRFIGQTSGGLLNVICYA